MNRILLWILCSIAGLPAAASAQLLVVEGEVDFVGPNPNFTVTVFEDGTIVVEHLLGGSTVGQLPWWALPLEPRPITSPVDVGLCADEDEATVKVAEQILGYCLAKWLIYGLSQLYEWVGEFLDGDMIDLEGVGIFDELAGWDIQYWVLVGFGEWYDEY